MKKRDLVPDGGDRKEKPCVGLILGIISNEIFDRITSVMLEHGITGNEIDYALRGVYVYGLPEVEL